MYFLGRDEGVSFGFLRQWRASLSVEQDGKFGNVSAVAPCAISRRAARGWWTGTPPKGADEYSWLIDAERPGEYPILARSNDIGGWHRDDLSTSEFPYRILADADFQPFGIAQNGLGTAFNAGVGDCG
ncbi:MULTISPECIES: hypothetical protein [Streptomyces]|uniref:Uncharacterized protein n=1 Tax=Streptomyces siderophoricus TaxID=2802281 RepID=A0ABS1N1V3_9ACTN|nr:hypothetical protein [Streptomyces sp. 9-7]MBL1094017.1 hypothetical protein [Streptomyces sp. 9-7]